MLRVFFQVEISEITKEQAFEHFAGLYIRYIQVCLQILLFCYLRDIAVLFRKQIKTLNINQLPYVLEKNFTRVC